jgi:hypothetical protein
MLEHVAADCGLPSNHSDSTDNGSGLDAALADGPSTLLTPKEVARIRRCSRATLARERR